MIGTTMRMATGGRNVRFKGIFAPSTIFFLCFQRELYGTFLRGVPVFSTLTPEEVREGETAKVT